MANHVLLEQEMELKTNTRLTKAIHELTGEISSATCQPRP
jgi:hypothetical protein